MKKWQLLKAGLLVLILSACAQNSNQTGREELPPEMTENMPEKEKADEFIIQAQAEGIRFRIALSETEAARELYTQLLQEEIRLEMHPYGGFEFVGDLPVSYTAKDSRISTRKGDVMLYQANKLVIFTGSNTWEYTSLGTVLDLDAIRSLEGLEEFELVLSA